MRKRYLGFVGVALVAVALWWDARPLSDRAAPDQPRVAVPAEPATGVALQLPQRGFLPAARNPFDVPRKAAPAPTVVVAPIIAPPKAPPLPYKYDGSGVVQGKSFVYLARQGRSFMVSAGDTLENLYLVEAVARDRVVLQYLPLGIRQVLMYAGGEAPPEVAVAPSTAQPLALQVDMPDEVVLGQEFVVTVALPGTAPLKATIEVGYDHEVLRMVGPGVRSAGRAVVEVASGSKGRAQLRFKVLAESPAPTDIQLQVDAADASGRRIPVSTPPAHTVSLVLPGGG